MAANDERLRKSVYEVRAEVRYAQRKFLGFSEEAATKHGVRASFSAKGLRLLEKLYRVHRDELRSAGSQLTETLQKATARIPVKVAVPIPP